MKYCFICLFFILLSSKILAQNYFLPDGEYMDTISNNSATCPEHNIYYYSVGGKYPESSSTLLKKVQSFLNEKNGKYNGSGYITFRFTVDCEGKPMKKVQVLQTDNEYKKTHFEKALVNELYDFFHTLNKWKDIKTKDGKGYAYIAFITFKIKDGKVINIIP